MIISSFSIFASDLLLRYRCLLHLVVIYVFVFCLSPVTSFTFEYIIIPAFISLIRLSSSALPIDKLTQDILNQSVSVMDSFAAGAIGGVTEVLTMYPLDVIKTRSQLSVGKGKSVGIVASLSNIVKQEGARRLYRGIVPPIFMEAPKRATKFAANDGWGQFYRKVFNVEKTNQSLSVLTGASAGATESFVVVPFDLIKIRLQDKKSAHLYLGTMDCFKKIVKHEGVLALYNGLEATMMRHITWNAGYFGVIFQVKAQLPAKPELLNSFIAGTIGGTVGTVLNTPFDVVKSRIQNSPRTSPSKLNWSVPSLFVVAKEEGFWALYKGFVPKVLRLGPGGGILLVVYTALMEFFAKYK